MESLGVYVAAHKAKVDCITVKGISDFADQGNKLVKTWGRPILKIRTKKRQPTTQ